MRRNHLLWLGPVLALFGVLSYFTIFYQWPILRDFPWLNLLLLLGAVAACWRGFVRARAAGGWRRIAGAMGMAWSIALTGLFGVYCFALSSSLPGAEQALAVGGAVPDVVLEDTQGTKVALRSPERTLLVFYRGHWCPFCMSELQDLQRGIAALHAAGTRVLAVSPESVEQNREVVEWLDLDYPILSDSELKATDGFGLRHAGIGPDGSDVPRPASYIVENGNVLWRNLTDNYRIRPRPGDILAALSSLDG